ncbi:MAG TPA: hypothetical protein VGP68_12745 [Gemmataceae bacterium]|jgi:hypothetical protein|nr:hypothetical protein [Gemmataceae bacterium]
MRHRDIRTTIYQHLDSGIEDMREATINLPRVFEEKTPTTVLTLTDKHDLP